MNKTYITIIVLLLLAFNIWQWWPDVTENSEISTQQTGNLSLINLPLPDYSRKSRLAVLTDPFYGDQPRELAQPQKSRQSNKNTKSRRAVDPFKDYELVGILYKNRRMSAFMVISGESRTVFKGDIINKSVLVERITESSVTLKHTRKNKKRTIKLQ